MPGVCISQMRGKCLLVENKMSLEVPQSIINRLGRRPSNCILRYRLQNWKQGLGPVFTAALVRGGSNPVVRQQVSGYAKGGPWVQWLLVSKCTTEHYWTCAQRDLTEPSQGMKFWYTVDVAEPRAHYYAIWNKPDTERQLEYNSTHTRYAEQSNARAASTQGLPGSRGGRMGSYRWMRMELLLGLMEKFCK